MSRPPEELLRSLATEPVPPPAEDATAAAVRRKVVVRSMAAALRDEGARRERARGRGRLVALLSMAAAVLLAIGVTWRWNAGRASGEAVSTALQSPAADAVLRNVVGPLVVQREAGEPVAASAAETPLSVGDAVASGPGARAEIELRSGARVEVEAGTKLRVARASEAGAEVAGERLGMTLGEITIHVPKLEAGKTFRVATPDAEVIVHGTTFRVTVRPDEQRPSGTVTIVAVIEGLVGVTHPTGQVELSRDQRWSSAPADPTVEAAPATPDPEAAAGPRPSTRSREPAAAPATASELAEQNRLLQAALAARRRGDDATAIRTLDELLAKHPHSPLAQEARVERMRALERSGDHAAAARDARRYLAEHRDGFARDEAKGLALPSGSASAQPSAPKP